MPRTYLGPRALRAAAIVVSGVVVLFSAPSVSPAARPSGLAVAGDDPKPQSRTQKKTPVRRTARRTSARRPAGPAPTSWTSPRGAPALVSDLSDMLSRRVRGGQWG